MGFRQDLKKTLNNQRGDILLVAVTLTALSLISSLVILNYSNIVESNSKKPRVKSMMTSLESKVRSTLLSPTSYTGCQTGENASDGKASCALDVAKINGMSLIMPDAPCPTSAPCGIRVAVTGVALNAAVSRVQVRIAYEGTDMNLRNIDLVMDIPTDIMQQTGLYTCPPSKPKFLGFTDLGRMICQALPDRADPNEFVSEIDKLALSTVKTLLPGMQTCPSGSDQYVSQVNWGDGGATDAFSITCVNRQNPFTAFGFLPKLPAAGGDLVYTVNPVQ